MESLIVWSLGCHLLYMRTVNGYMDTCSCIQTMHAIVKCVYILSLKILSSSIINNTKGEGQREYMGHQKTQTFQ